MTVPAKLNRPKAKIDMKRRLIDAAREEFSEKGLEAATTRSIAQRAACNEVTIFRHFESKQKLLAAVVQDTSEEFRNLCECRDGLSGNLLEDLTKFARVHNESLEKCEGMARTLIGESRRHPTLCKELIGDVLEPFHRSIVCYLQEQQSLGKINPNLQLEAFAEIFTAALFGGVMRRSAGLSQLNGDDWIHHIVTIMAEGLICR